MSDGIIFTGLIAFVLMVGALAIVAAVQDGRKYNRLMEQCLLDHKEYECVSLLKSNDSSMVIVSPPIVVGR